MVGYKLRLDVKSESGHYLVQDIGDNGFVNNTIEVTTDELPTLMTELCDMCGDESALMLDALRSIYQELDPKSIEFKGV
jgi:hypothetical protein